MKTHACVQQEKGEIANTIRAARWDPLLHIVTNLRQMRQWDANEFCGSEITDCRSQWRQTAEYGWNKCRFGAIGALTISIALIYNCFPCVVPPCEMPWVGQHWQLKLGYFMTMKTSYFFWVSPDFTLTLWMLNVKGVHQSDQLKKLSFSHCNFSISRSPMSTSV